MTPILTTYRSEVLDALQPMFPFPKCHKMTVVFHRNQGVIK